MTKKKWEEILLYVQDSTVQMYVRYSNNAYIHVNWKKLKNNKNIISKITGCTKINYMISVYGDKWRREHETWRCFQNLKMKTKKEQNIFKNW